MMLRKFGVTRTQALRLVRQILLCAKQISNEAIVQFLEKSAELAMELTCFHRKQRKYSDSYR